MRRFYIWLLLVTLLSSLSAGSLRNLSLDQAIKIVKKENLEINIAKFDEDVAKLGVKVASGYNYGKLDATIMGLRSNDAGNVFGFKLQSREATFRDFGFSDFIDGVAGATSMAGNSLDNFSNMLKDPNLKAQMLDMSPKDLNYPDARNHYDIKLTYMIPLYVGGKLMAYKRIAKQMAHMSKLDKRKVVGKKLAEVKGAFYDITLLNHFEKDLKTVKNNIEKLKSAVIEFKKEGYAKKTDLLEVESKLSNVERMLFQAKAYKELSYEFLSFLLNHDVKSIREIPNIDKLCCTVTKEDVLKHNSDIQKADTGLKIQSDMVNVTKSKFLPEVGAFAEYGSADDEFWHNFRDHDRYTVGVQAKLNIINGGVDYNTYQQERLKRMKVKKQTLLARKGMALKYKKMMTEINNLTMQVKALDKELELSKEIYNSYQARYKEGLVSINDVIIKQSMWIEKLLKLLDIKNKKNKKILEIETLIY